MPQSSPTIPCDSKHTQLIPRSTIDALPLVCSIDPDDDVTDASDTVNATEYETLLLGCPATSTPTLNVNRWFTTAMHLAEPSDT